MFKKSQEVYLDNHLIIKLVSEHPEIWNKNLIAFRDRQKNDEAWKDITEKLFPDYHNCSNEIKSLLEKMVLRRWSSMRDYYIKWSKKCQGQPEAKWCTKKYIYHKHLAFLEPFVNTTCRSSIRKERVKRIKPVEIEVEPDVKIEVKTEVKIEAEDGVEFVGQGTTNEFSSYEEPIDVRDSQLLGTMSPSVSNERNPLHFGDNYKAEDSNTNYKYHINFLHELSDRISNRHYMFFQGLLPSLKDFNEEETLELQINVIQCIKNIKIQRQSNY